ncbi:D-serine dehydratase [Trichomonascus vanleenenianus]|uniref:D-serine ammonia-lyase DSD1 n=1 Tax=Trichomonascus vanleenenianus TaxID=2268995 RepID=UPI003ECB7E63
MPPCDLYPTADVNALKKEYVGKTLAEIPTPAFIVDRAVMKKNCDTMLARAKKLKAQFRAHVKTHKCDEGVELQLGDFSSRVVVSTLMEAWRMLPYYKSGKITDVLYGLPIVNSRVGEIIELKKHVPNVRLMIDHPCQLDMLIAYSKEHNVSEPWSFFVKVNMGTNRAGLETESEELTELIKKALGEQNKPFLSLYGFYCHAGHSYASPSSKEATSYLKDEIVAANAAAKIAKQIQPDLDLTISVGSTPTAHASDIIDLSTVGELHAELELHAGNYPFCDYQQMATHCITQENVACSLLAEVASCYNGRGDRAPGEVLINAGVIALAREPGPLPGFGKVATKGYEDWYVGRLSQEHGILVPSEGTTPKFPPLGQRFHIIPQHSCITANAFAWYYIVDGSDKVVDIWTAWRGW